MGKTADVLRAQGIILTPGPPPPPPQTQASSSASSSSSPPSTAQSWQYHSRAHQPTPYQPSSSRRRDKRRARSTNAEPDVSDRVHSHAYPHPYVAGAPPTLTLRRSSHPPSDANARLRHINALEVCRNPELYSARSQHALLFRPNAPPQCATSRLSTPSFNTPANPSRLFPGPAMVTVAA